jgi:hypothetical protein
LRKFWRESCDVTISGGNHRQPTLVARRAKGVAPQVAPWVSLPQGFIGWAKSMPVRGPAPPPCVPSAQRLSAQVVSGVGQPLRLPRRGRFACEGIGRWLAQSVHHAAWSSFIAKLTYKAESADRLAVKVDARGTSQQCPWGAPAPKKLWDRKHHCPVCGLTTTRDPAAAFEILRRRLRLRTAMPAIAGMALEVPAFRHGA